MAIEPANITWAKELDFNTPGFQYSPPIQPFTINRLPDWGVIWMGVRYRCKFTVRRIELWFEFRVGKFRETVII